MTAPHGSKSRPDRTILCGGPGAAGTVPAGSNATSGQSVRPILQQGRNCWRIETADRLAIIVDAADYFRIAKAAMAAARHTIMMIGWDFDMRISLEPQGAIVEGPDTLGEFLNWLTDRTPGLETYVLQWDLSTVEALGRGALPLFVTEWLTSDRQHFRLDGVHPLGAAHHAKIVVIDDVIAFCGGIDMTADRWDTRAHADEEPYRTTPGGKPTQPWHDATLAVDGALARALGDLARRRWELATGDALPPPPGDVPIWPEGLEPAFRDVPAGIARTFPTHDDRDEVREIEAFYLDAIAAARETIYFESQYFASRAITDAMIARLAEPDGPEIVVVMPEHADGWLRRKAMDGARQRLLDTVWRRDPHRRFAAYYPVTEGGAAIYVHAKVTVVDDRALRVGSSNLNNRSMGFDSECDIAIDMALGGSEADRATILGVRASLLAEHLGTDRERFDATLGETGSLIGAIERLRRGEGRSLRPFTRTVIEEDDSVLAENELSDPEEAEPDILSRLGKAASDFAAKLE